MSNFVLKYRRGEEVKYISHLDFVRFIQRVIRRADLPMAFSQGFNPHPLMAVALPLSVGVTADAELMRISFEGDFSAEFIKDTINKAFPKGFEVIDVREYFAKEYDFTKINRAEYIVKCEVFDGIVPDIDRFLQNDTINILKKSKSGIKEADIKPHIHSLELIGKEENIVTFKMCVDAGNTYNLKPDTVIEAMQKYDENFKVEFFSSHRCRLLCDDKELF